MPESNIILVEHGFQVKDFLGRGFRDKGQWIALSPSAMWHLDKERIPYKIPEDFYLQQGLEDLCILNHQKIEMLCSRLDEEALKYNSELKEVGIKPFLFEIFPIFILFDSLISRIFQIKSILKAYPGYKIWAHAGFQDRHWDFDICFSNNDYIWGLLLALKGWTNEIELLRTKYKIRGMVNIIGWSKEFIKKVIERSRFKYELINNKPKLQKKKTIILNDGAYDWGAVLDILKSRGFHIFKTNDSLLKGIIRKKDKNNYINEIIESDKNLMECFKVEGINFYPLVRERLAWIWENNRFVLRQVISRIRYIHRNYNVKAVVSAITPTFSGHAINQVAKHFGLRTLKWQHGFIYFNKSISQMNEFKDLIATDLFLSYGDEAKRAYEPYATKFPAKVIAIGSSRLDALIIALKDKEISNCGDKSIKRILYVTAQYQGNHWYCGFYPPFNDRFFYRSQLSIIMGLKKIRDRFKEVQIDIKLPFFSLNQEPPWAQELISQDRIRIIQKSQTFSELLSENDIIIIDSPTTTVLEAATTLKPIFVLTSNVVYSDSAKEMLAKRAVCSQDAVALMSKMEDYLERGEYAASLKDREFLNKYGIYREDNGSKERALKILEEIY